MKRLSAFLSALLFVGAGCFGSSSTDTGRLPAPVGQDGPSFIGSWVMATATLSGKGEQDVTALASMLSLSADGRLSAVICNSMSGEYSIEDGRLEAPQLISTLKFCTGLPGEIEVAFMSDIAAGMRIEGGNGTLTLLGDSGARFTYDREDSGDQPQTLPEEQGGRVEAAGTVISVDLEKMAVDGPAEIRISTADGAKLILVPSFGLNLCAGGKNIADVSTLRAGQRVEVRGAAGEEDSIIPCQSADDYLRVVTP